MMNVTCQVRDYPTEQPFFDDEFKSFLVSRYKANAISMGESNSSELCFSVSRKMQTSSYQKYSLVEAINFILVYYFHGNVELSASDVQLVGDMRNPTQLLKNIVNDLNSTNGRGNVYNGTYLLQQLLAAQDNTVEWKSYSGLFDGRWTGSMFNYTGQSILNGQLSVDQARLSMSGPLTYQAGSTVGIQEANVSSVYLILAGSTSATLALSLPKLQISLANTQVNLNCSLATQQAGISFNRTLYQMESCPKQGGGFDFTILYIMIPVTIVLSCIVHWRYEILDWILDLKRKYCSKRL